MRLHRVRRRSLKEYMEWLLVNRTVKVNGGPGVFVTEVEIESDGWLVIHFDGTYAKVALAKALEFELVEEGS